MTSKHDIDITLPLRYSQHVTRRVFTLRIDAAERTALENLSKVERRPINQLANEAIKAYLDRRGRKERDLEASLESLRAYRRRDPQFTEAIAAFVEAEASLEDPLEGEPIEGHLVAGPVQTEIRQILDA